MLCRALLVILMSTPLCAGGGAIEDACAERRSIEDLAQHCLSKLRHRQRAQAAAKLKKEQSRHEDPQASNDPAPVRLENISEEKELNPEDEPAELPEQPQVASPQQPPVVPQASRSGGSLLGLATVGFLAVCYNGYQSYYHKRPPHNILHEKEPSRAGKPICIQK